MLLNLSFSLTFLLFFINSLNINGSFTTFGFTNETDKRALLAIKDLIPGDPFGVLSSWNDSLHFCKWQGVTCGRRHQRVTRLDLSSQKLHGSISPEIGNITFLKVIDMMNNSFYGTIPQEVGRLYRLQNLYLSNNSFEGEIPTNLTHCLNLREINLNGNNLGGKIPSQLGYLSKLLRLRVISNNLIGIIPPSLGNLTSLLWFSVSLNNLEGRIPHEFGKLSNLQFLQISKNNFSGSIPSQLYNISSIYYLAAAVNQIQGQLPSDLGLTLPKLEFLLLGANQLSGPIPASLPNASDLLFIDLGTNKFRGQIPLNLGNLKDLIALRLAENPLGSKEGTDLSFLSSLTNCTSLKFLIMFQANLKGILPNSIANLSSELLWLELDENYIFGSIPLGVGNLINLIGLALGSNMFSSSIPDSIGKLVSLEGLSIAFANISGVIPSSLGNISSLNQLFLDRNRIEGGIPVSLGNCNKLEQIYLSGNLISGSFPEGIFRLSSLRLAYFDRNYLVGSLPSQVGALRNLQALNISENKLAGEVPSTLGNCLVLEFLVMRNNLFEGPIPETFSQLRGLQVLDLSQNNFSGNIPRFLGNFTLIEYLNLSFNIFEGEVPKEGVFKNISEFNISGNKNLCGGIKELQLPACPTKVPKKKEKSFNFKVIAGASLLLIAFFIACGCALLYWNKKSKRKTNSDFLMESQYPKVSFGELFKATDGFSLANLLGEGRYGSVYKGTLNLNNRSTSVAVKVLNLREKGANKSFMAECEAVRNIRHRNLVKIITSCSSIDFKGYDFKALVFELMPRGSLESWLHHGSSENQNLKNLNLIQRLNIAIDVATALDYLHNHSESPIIHCDLKPSNILLDNDFCAHVGDFGLAKFLLVSSSTSNPAESSSTGIRGTIGYVTPEYGMGCEISTKGDIYSYGILLLEMFTGKRPTDNMFEDTFGLQNYVKMALPDRVMEIVHSQLLVDEENESNYERSESITNNTVSAITSCLVSILHIGVICSSEMPRERMDARTVLMELQVIRNNLLGRKR